LASGGLPNYGYAERVKEEYYFALVNGYGFNTFRARGMKELSIAINKVCVFFGIKIPPGSKLLKIFTL